MSTRVRLAAVAEHSGHDQLRRRDEYRKRQPRDLVDRCADICRYENRPFIVTDELLERAWRYYFGGRRPHP